MEPAVKKQSDVARLSADLPIVKLELLSAQCATDRLRLQASSQDIVAFGRAADSETNARLSRGSTKFLFPD